jgi:hypothetical protein
MFVAARLGDAAAAQPETTGHSQVNHLAEVVAVASTSTENVAPMTLKSGIAELLRASLLGNSYSTRGETLNG